MLSESRFKLLLQQQTSAARTVFDAVPSSEPWTISQICSDLKRLNKNYDQQHVQGCLGHLVGVGLIAEKGSMFKRAEFRTIAKKDADEIIDGRREAPSNEEPKKPAAPTDRIAALAERFRLIATDLKAAAGELEDVALDIQQSNEDVDKKLSAARQLKALLEKI